MSATAELCADGADCGYRFGPGWRLEGSAPGGVEPGALKPGNKSTFAQRFRPICATRIASACAAGDPDDAYGPLSTQAMGLVDVYACASTSASEISRLERRRRRRFNHGTNP